MASLGSSMGSAAKYRLGTAVLSLGVDNRRFDAQLMRAQGRVQRFAGAASQAGFAASQAVAAPILLIGAMAVRVAAEYDQTMQHVKAVSGSTATEFQALTAQTQALAETTRFTMKQVGDAQVFLAMAGMDTTKILRSMPEILNLATASGLQLARVSDLVTNIMTAFRVEADGLNRVMDVLSVTFTSSNVSMEQLAQSMKFVAPVASAMGHSIEETAASIGKLGDAGIQAGMAGTYLRSMLGELGRPSGRIQKQFDRLGISTRNLEGDIRSAVEYIEEYERIGADATLGYTIHGRRGGTPAVLLASEGAESIRRLEAQTRAGFAETEKIAKTMLDHLNADIAILFSKWQTFLNKIAKSGPMALSRTVVQRLHGALDSMNEMSEASLKWKVALAGAAAVLIPILTVVSALVLRFSEMRANILAARDMRAQKAMMAAAEADRKRMQDARLWASENKKNLVQERKLIRDKALLEQKEAKRSLDRSVSIANEKQKAQEKAQRAVMMSRIDDQKQAVAMMRAEDKALNRLKAAQEKVYGTKVAKKVSGLSPQELAKTNKGLRQALDHHKNIKEQIREQKQAVKDVGKAEKMTKKARVEARRVLKDKLADLREEKKLAEKSVKDQTKAARQHRAALGELRSARKELKAVRSGEVTAAKNLNVIESKATKAARIRLDMANRHLEIARGVVGTEKLAHHTSQQTLTNARRGLDVANAQSVHAKAQERVDKQRSELNKQVLRDENKATTALLKRTNAMAPGAIALQRMATWGKSFVATLFGAAGMIVGLGLVLGTLAKITRVGVERAFKKSEIAAMDYASALKEIARVEKELRDNAANERYTQTYGPQGYSEYGEITAEWRNEQLDLLRGRLGIAQLEAIKSEWADELNSYHKLIRDDLSKMRSGDINFQQWESGIKTTAEEIDNLEEKAMMFAKRFPEAVTNYEEAFAIVRGELQQTAALMETLQAYSEPLEEVGRALNDLQYNKIPSDEITKAEALSQLDDLSQKLDAVEKHMLSTGASTEEFASEFEILRDRIETTRYDTELLTQAYEEQAEVIRIMPELPEPNMDFFSDFAREAKDSLMLIQDVQKSMWLDNPEGKSIFSATAQFDQQMLDDAEKRMKDSLKELQDRLAAPFENFGSQMGQNFARAFLRRDEGDSIVELLKESLFASTLQSAVESIGSELGRRFAINFGAEITAAKALWSKAISSSLLAPIAAAVAGASWIIKTALHRGDQSDAEKAAINREKALEAVQEATNKVLEERREIEADLEQARLDAIAAEEEAAASLLSRYDELASAMVDAGEVTEDFMTFITDTPELAAALSDEIAELTAMFEQLADAKVSLETVNEFRSGISSLLPDTDMERLTTYGEVSDELRASLLAAGGDDGLLDVLASKVRALYEFDEAVEQFKDTGKITDTLADSLMNLSGVDLRGLVAQMGELSDRMEDIQERIGFLDDLSSGLKSLLPESGLDLFFDTGVVDDALLEQLKKSGVDMTLIENLSTAMKNLREFEESISDSTVDTDLEDLSEAAQETTRSLELLQELQSGLRDYLPDSAPLAELHDFFQSGRLPTKLLTELVAAGVPQELISTFASARSDLVAFYREAQDQKWRDEFAYEQREYQLQMRVEESALDLYNAVSVLTGDLDDYSDARSDAEAAAREAQEASQEAQRQALEEAQEAQRSALKQAVEAAAQALFDSVGNLRETLDEELSATQELYDAIQIQIDEALVAARELLVEGVGEAAEAFDESLKALAEALQNTINGLQSAINALIGAIRELIKAINNIDLNVNVTTGGGGGTTTGTTTGTPTGGGIAPWNKGPTGGGVGPEQQCRLDGGEPQYNALGIYVSCKMPEEVVDPTTGSKPTTPSGNIDNDILIDQCTSVGGRPVLDSYGTFIRCVVSTPDPPRPPKPPDPPDPPDPYFDGDDADGGGPMASPTVNINVETGDGSGDMVVTKIVQAIEENRGRIRDTLNQGF